VIGILNALGARDTARQLLDRLEGIDPALLADDALARGQLHFARFGFGYMLGEGPWEGSQEARRAAAAFDEAASDRWRNLSQGLLAMAHAAIGDHAAADRAISTCLEGAVRMEDAFLIANARTYSMLILAERGDPRRREEAAKLAGSLVAQGAPPAAVGAAWGALAHVRLSQGRLDEAREAAEKALSILEPMLSYRPAPYRTLVYALLGAGRAEEARRVAEEASALRHRLGQVGMREVALRLAVAEARRATRDADLAARDLGDILALIAHRAGNIPDAAARARYLEDVPENARARALGAAWGVGG
jgi:tetratricopeptide (TPR) repeat protein